MSYKEPRGDLAEIKMRKLVILIAAALMLLAAGCGKVEFVNTDFDLPDDKQGPEYGAETP